MARINTTTRPFYCVPEKEGRAFFEDAVEFDWHSGMSWQVRQRSSDAMHDAILQKRSKHGLKPEEILEVSTASHDYELGQALSAMNLMYTQAYPHSPTFDIAYSGTFLIQPWSR